MTVRIDFSLKCKQFLHLGNVMIAFNIAQQFSGVKPFNTGVLDYLFNTHNTTMLFHVRGTYLQFREVRIPVWYSYTYTYQLFVRLQIPNALIMH